MTDWVRRALTRRLVKKGPRGKIEVQGLANERLVYVVKFSLGMAGCLTVLEVTSIVFLHDWNHEIFAAITGLIGTVTGIIIGQKA